MPAKKSAAKKAAKVKKVAKVKKTATEPKTSSSATSASSNGKVAAFTLDDVHSLLKSKKPEKPETTEKATKKVAKKKVVAEIEEAPHQAQSFGAASLADILGYNPAEPQKHNGDETKVPKKFKIYYKLLVELRNHVNEELDLHTRETLKKSNKDDSGDIASYSQHMADEGTDNFDRDFALSLVSTEQEALTEIEEAIGRIFDGTYGVCEITGEPIAKERLLAVPFTKHSLEGQKELEKNKRFYVQRGGVYSTGIEDSTQFLANDDGD